ncbi:MAG: CoA transferase [Candidatus Limivicinus sp.]|nr:CoA transferase [Candidatus Limivicinus sp.]
MKHNDIPAFGLLSGLRVVMIGLSVAAPFAGELYAEHGADVIWIENPKVVDSARTSRKGGAWQQDRRNMRSLAMNYRTAEGREAFLKLLEKTDVLIEASVGGSFEKAGYSDQVLWEHNPGLIIVHISGYGQTGLPEYVHRASFDPIAQAFGCAMRMNGVDGIPSIPAMPFPGDYTAAFYAFGMSLAALYKRQQTGKGESIDIAQFELMMRIQSNYPTDYLRYGLDYIKEGPHSRICAGYGTYKCMDGEEIYTLFLGSGAVERGLAILGLEYGSEDFPAGSSLVPVNTPSGDKLEAALEAYVSTHTAEEVETAFCAARVPCSRLMDYEQAKTNPQYLARKVFTTWTAADGKTQIPGVNVMPKLKNNPGQIWRGAPNVGMDNEDILSELGYAPQEIQSMYQAGLLDRKEYFEP